MTKRVEVVAAIVIDSQQRILMAQRASWQHQGSKWEFPGGKIEANESHLQALTRELKEEVGLHINAQACKLFKAVHHDYSDKQVSLYFYLVNDFRGIAKGLEGQPLTWVDVQNLPQLTIPDANQIIVDTLLETWPLSSLKNESCQ
ncbi:MAG: 8-oxo-dGTP diphosphatase MutT [Gammaproteobacteria bacterium]|nr:8-oxo-dGTP diphosphatase MutT [Gammaproteobacteria bacterium]